MTQVNNIPKMTTPLRVEEFSGGDCLIFDGDGFEVAATNGEPEATAMTHAVNAYDDLKRKADEHQKLLTALGNIRKRCYDDSEWGRYIDKVLAKELTE